MSVRKVLDKIRQIKGLKSDADIANIFGVSRQAVDAWKKKGSVPKYVLVYLDEIQMESDIRSKELTFAGFMPAEKGQIPVVAIADAGEGIESLDGGYPVGYSDEYVSRPAGMRDPQAYAVRISNEARSMEPVLRPGMLCVVSPNLDCVSGDVVVCKFKNHNTTVKQMFVKDGEVLLKSYNPDFEDITIKKKDLLFCHPVVWWRRPK